jgi:hypothetical protein
MLFRNINKTMFETFNEAYYNTVISINKADVFIFSDFICDRALDPIIYCGYYVSEQAKEAMYKLEGIHEWLDRYEILTITL